VAAPGGSINDATHANIVTTWGEGTGDDDYWGVGGRPYFGATSAAAPVAAGVAGLILSHWPIWGSVSFTNDDVDAVLKITARDLGDDDPNPYFGYGLIRADAALSLIDAPHELHKDEVAPSRISYVDWFTEKFINVPCVNSGRPEFLGVAAYEMVGYGSFEDSALAVWTRGRGSVGWRNFCEEESRISVPIDGLAYGNWAEVIPETVTAEGCSLRAYTYKFYRNGTYVGWYPVNGDTGQPVCQAGQSTLLAYSYITAGEGDKSRGGTSALDAGRGGANPSRGSIRVTWSIESRQHVQASLFDVAGRRVRLLYSGIAEPGDLQITWDGSDAGGRRTPSGVYFLRMQAGASARTVKVVR
jgi:hypothetical protein